MNKNGNISALLVPDARGWRMRVPGAEEQALPTLDEAVAAVPAGAHVELALPCHSVLLERHKLPATDRAELADMLQLQLEKTLPFPVERLGVLCPTCHRHPPRSCRAVRTGWSLCP